MIVVEEGEVRFQYRVVGIALNDGRVLLHRAENDDFWALLAPFDYTVKGVRGRGVYI